MEQPLLQGCEFNFEPAKRFFTEAIQLTQAVSNKMESSGITTPVKVDSGECTKIVLFDEYNGIKLYKFFAKENTAMILSEEENCKGFILIEGDMSICYDIGSKQIRLPKDRHFFYVNKGEDLVLEFFMDTWFYMISMQS